MEPENSLPRSQVPTTCPYPEPDPDKTYAQKLFSENYWQTYKRYAS